MVNVSARPPRRRFDEALEVWLEAALIANEVMARLVLVLAVAAADSAGTFLLGKLGSALPTGDMSWIATAIDFLLKLFSIVFIAEVAVLAIWDAYLAVSRRIRSRES
jgi:hypothetical protein